VAKINADADIQVASIKALSDQEKENKKLTSIAFQNLKPAGVE